MERAQSFIHENRRVVLIGAAVAAVVAAGGAAYYASTSAGASDTGKKKKPKSGKKRKTTKDVDGPILEERAPKVEVTDDDVPPTEEQLLSKSEDERMDMAASFKEKGNNAYKQRQFQEAVKHYTNAIFVSPKPEPVFYSNRAACYMNVSPPEYEKVISDCDEAIKLDQSYVKALNRRASALEALHKYVEALRDFTAGAILEKFSNQASAQSVDRVLKKLSETEAQRIIKERGPRLPAFTFISAYLAAFRDRPKPELKGDQPGDAVLLQALDALDAADYPHATSLSSEALVQGLSTDEGKAVALNLRGTFKFLMGDTTGSKADFQESIAVMPSLTQTWVKLASVFMEEENATEAFACFDKAQEQNKDDPDIYYHKGQVLFIMGRFAEAGENYVKSTELDDTFVFSHIQLAVAQYKDGQLAKSMASFRRTLKDFPQRSEPQNYYGELLLDQQRFDDAVEKFDRAIELERANTDKKRINVLPLVNKALAVYQGKQDFAAAERLCNEALRIDSDCDAAVATLAQFSLQQGIYEKAAEHLAKQAELARTEPELVNALSYKFASAAQLEFMNNYPHMRSQLGPIAQNMA